MSKSDWGPRTGAGEPVFPKPGEQSKLTATVSGPIIPLGYGDFHISYRPDDGLGCGFGITRQQALKLMNDLAVLIGETA